MNSNDTNNNSTDHATLDSHWFDMDKVLKFRKFDGWFRDFRMKVKKFDPDLINWIKSKVAPEVAIFMEYLLTHTHIL